MRKTFLLPIIFLFIACADDESVDCATLDVVTKNILVEVVDSEGNNLIQNGTYKAEEISVRLKNSQTCCIGGVFEDVPGLETLISVQLLPETETFYIIELSNEEEGELVVNNELESSECFGMIPTAISATYNSTSLQSRDFDSDTLLFTVMLQ